ncbi:ABC transporter ATP-binding protein [Periweissella fabaria]|uniref:ABC transporter ATP-binding protein NatA n=1 Tax=Periweissella fabaria TaxID=546157 RepID=A0ABN8BM90_9LACO|nr:ABC transporter ATP-binding protein [Periweissella fabaria]MCM0596970.1 ABC transporter ATP-binding protein [Periweissella fabaria]CAH0416925.1 ABC transporter ATP-binding protein NatA [Periweissella fabaria]
MLKVEKITKKFKGVDVLKDVTFNLEPGQLVHIRGINGSGKSTIFKIITGLLKPATGTIMLGDNDVVGALIENPGFLEFEDALTNLRFLADLNHNYNEAYIIELMKKFQLDPANKQPVAKYSIGMRQKLGIIQAIMENQNIILLDEPTRGLDVESINQFAALIMELKAAGKSIIVASHDDVATITYDQQLQLVDGCLS